MESQRTTELSATAVEANSSESTAPNDVLHNESPLSCRGSGRSDQAGCRSDVLNVTAARAGVTRSDGWFGLAGTVPRFDQVHSSTDYERWARKVSSPSTEGRRRCAIATWGQGLTQRTLVQKRARRRRSCPLAGEVSGLRERHRGGWRCSLKNNPTHREMVSERRKGERSARYAAPQLHRLRQHPLETRAPEATKPLASQGVR